VLEQKECCNNLARGQTGEKSTLKINPVARLGNKKAHTDPKECCVRNTHTRNGKHLNNRHRRTEIEQRQAANRKQPKPKPKKKKPNHPSTRMHSKIHQRTEYNTAQHNQIE
jgi:hypothetical protein